MSELDWESALAASHPASFKAPRGNLSPGFPSLALKPLYHIWLSYCLLAAFMSSWCRVQCEGKRTNQGTSSLREREKIPGWFLFLCDLLFEPGGGVVAGKQNHDRGLMLPVSWQAAAALVLVSPSEIWAFLLNCVGIQGTFAHTK